MKKLTIAILITLGAWSLNAIAHEGHNHDAPTSLKAPKGGIIKALDEARVEVVAKGKDLKIYVYDKEMKPAQASTFKVIATAELPRTKKEESVALNAQDTFFDAVYEAKGAHRYTLKLAVTDPKTNRTDNLTFTVEPRK